MELNQREKAWILAAILILTPLLFFRFAFLPLDAYRQKQRVDIRRIEEKIRQMDALGQELKHLERTRSSQSTSLSKDIDRILRQQQLKLRSRTLVDNDPDGRQRLVLKLEEVNLTELIQLLYNIENALPVIAIESININPAYQNKKRLRISSALSSW